MANSVYNTAFLSVVKILDLFLKRYNCYKFPPAALYKLNESIKQSVLL